MDAELLIVGGGLTGVSIARAAAEAGVDYRLIEARSRLGGRILSWTSSRGGARYDLGPAWFWPGQPRMAGLVAQLGMRAFAQHAQGAALWQDASGAAERVSGAGGGAAYRIDGGLAAVVEGLAADLAPERVALGSPVVEIARQGDAWRVTRGDAEALVAARVAVATPPRLAAAAIDLSGAISTNAIGALSATPTWMAGHAKLLAVYDQPFWRARGLSGDAFSARGPLAQIHDASPADGREGALFGFVGLPAEARGALGAAALQEAAMWQLGLLFGPEAAAPREAVLADWSLEPFTAVEADGRSAPPPRYGRPRELATTDAQGLVFAATELAPTDGGLLEGALAAAEAATALLGFGDAAGCRRGAGGP